jgi:hypothetical protein
MKVRSGPKNFENLTAAERVTDPVTDDLDLIAHPRLCGRSLRHQISPFLSRVRPPHPPVRRPHGIA